MFSHGHDRGPGPYDVQIAEVLALAVIHGDHTWMVGGVNHGISDMGICIHGKMSD